MSDEEDDIILSELSDEDLVQQLQAGATELALTELERRYGKRIHHFVQGMVRDPHLASDVTQEVFEKVLLKNSLYRLGTNFRAWLFEVARNPRVRGTDVQQPGRVRLQPADLRVGPSPSIP